MDAPVVIPITFWNGVLPTQQLSCISVTPNMKQIVTSSYNGQLCILDFDVNNKEIVPRNVLIAHEDPVMCLVCTNDYIVSASEGGELCRWNLEDGYCIKKYKSIYIHKHMKLFKKSQDEELIFTCGYYTEVFVIHPYTLQTVFVLNSKTDSDWISCFEVIKSLELKSDAVIGITLGGRIKLWDVEELNSEHAYEKQSNLLPVKNVIDLKVNNNQDRFLILALKNWYIFDSRFLKLIHTKKEDEKLLAGYFLNENIVIASDCGKFYLYKITDVVTLGCVYWDKSIKRMLAEPAVNIFNNQYFLYGDFNGNLSIWDVDLEEVKLKTKLFEDLAVKKNGLFEKLIMNEVTACIYISSLDKFLVGCCNGAIIDLPAFETVLFYYFKGAKKPYLQSLSGHISKVTCLLYPHEKYSHYHESYLISGSRDFSVCLWDLYKSQLLHKFCVHSGEIIKLIIPPEDCKIRIKNSICSVSSDHSVALLNLKERKCIILASRHLFPVITINWKPLDDYIIVECFDGTIYVWEMETGHLDRTLDGASAQEVLYACNNNNQSSVANFYIEDKCVVGKDYLKRDVLRYEEMNSIMAITEFHKNHVILFNLENLLKEMNTIPFIDLMDPVMNQKIYSLTQPVNPDVQKKISELLDKLKIDKMEEVKEEKFLSVEELAKFLLAILHEWGKDEELDSILINRLRLQKPDKNADFAIMARNGIFTFFNKNFKSSSLTAFKYISTFALANVLGVPEIWKILAEKNKINLEILASSWQNSSFVIRNVIRKLLTFYLQNLTPEEYANLLEHWFKYLPHFKVLDKSSNEKFDFENRDIKKIALVIFGIIGSDLKFKMVDVKLQENYIFETCASFLYLLHLPEEHKSLLNELQTIAIDLIGRGYTVWEPYLKIEKILLALLDICSDVYKVKNSTDHVTPNIDKSLTAHDTLKSIALARTDKFILYLISEINQMKNQLKTDHAVIDKSKTEIILIFQLLMEKTPYSMLQYLNETITILLFCIYPSQLKQDDIKELIPVLRKFYQIHHCVPFQRIAVGQTDGLITIHDLKSGKSQAISAHDDSVSALMFSPDGRLLASYSCFENKISFWQVTTGMFGLGQLHVKNIKSYPMPELHDEEITNHLEIARLSWIDNKSGSLSLCNGSETAFHL